MTKDKARDEEMAFAPITEYRLVVGVFGIIFDEDSASAKHESDLFVYSIQNRTIRGGWSVRYALQESRNHTAVSPSRGLARLEPALRLICERLPMARRQHRVCATVSDLFSSEE